MLNWDSTRRDGRTAYSGKLKTIFGKVLSQDRQNIVIKTDTEQILIGKGSYRYEDIPRELGYFIICNNKLVDYI